MSQPLQTRDLLAVLASGEPVSGANLARELGVTRAAIWKHIAALRDAGLPVAAQAGKGYCLPWPIELLEADAIARQLDEVVPVDVSWSVDSTQEVARRLAADAPDGAAALTEWQTGGRGRRGRAWLSPPGLNLHLSYVQHFERGFAHLAGLSLAVGVSVAAVLEEMGVAQTQLKWPNDVYVEGRKLAGILIELSGEFEGPCRAIIGIGVNVRLPDTTHQTLQRPIADLASCLADKPPSRNVLAARLINRLRVDLHRFDEAGLAPFMAAYAAKDWLAGKSLRFEGDAPCQNGVGAGINEQGALLVKTDQGLVQIHGGEVSVRVS